MRRSGSPELEIRNVRHNRRSVTEVTHCWRAEVEHVCAMSHRSHRMSVPEHGAAELLAWILTMAAPAALLPRLSAG
jgi:hypothetical protein